jgi:hypothetical protein
MEPVRSKRESFRLVTVHVAGTLCVVGGTGVARPTRRAV